MNKLPFFVASTLLIFFASIPIHAASISLTSLISSVKVGDPLPALTTPVPESAIYFLLLIGLMIFNLKKVAFKKVITAILLLFSFPSVQASSFFEFDIIAKTGDSPPTGGGVLTSISSRVSINDNGNVAFLGMTATGGSLFFKEEYLPNPVNISFATPSTARIYSPGIQINNYNQIIATDRSNSTRLVRVWEGDAPGKNTVIARGNISGGSDKFPAAFDSVFGYPSFSNGLIPFVAFSALDSDLDTVLSTPIIFDDTGKLNFKKEPLATPLRPTVADSGQVVVRASFNRQTPGSIRLYEHNLSSFTEIATPTEFPVLGRAPGISDDGKIVVFYGSRIGEEGIFASIKTPLGRKIIQIAGVSGNGILETGETYDDLNKNDIFDSASEIDDGPFSGFSPDEKVAVTSTHHTQGHITIVYKAKDAIDGKEGIYTSRVRFYDREKLYTLPDVRLPYEVIKQGDTISGLSGEIDLISLHDPINIYGQIAFHATTTSGKQVVISATKVGGVVNVVTHGFNPTPPGIIPHFGSWKDFRKGWFDLAAQLNDIPIDGISPYHGNVKTYVSEWESSEGFLIGFVSLFIGKYCDALAETELDVVKKLKFEKWSKDIKEYAKKLAETSGILADEAADNIATDLQANWLPAGPCKDTDPHCDINDIEEIHLIGHSRGGAVNAEVSKILVDKGYNVKQVTVLDGYSTDWKDDGGLIGDISISNQTSVRTGGKKINYRVKQSLSAYISEEGFENKIINFIIQYIAFKLNVDPTLVKLDDEFLSALKKYDLRAPHRTDFENIFVETSGPKIDPFDKDCRGSSQHLNITHCYTKSDILNLGAPNYIFDNFVGESNN